MQIEYDRQADALYIRFREAAPADNLDIQDGVTVDFDADRRIIGIEVLSVSQRLPADALSSITVQNLIGAGA